MLRFSARHLAAALAAALVAFSASPNGAVASYQVHACDTALAGANNSWSTQGTAPDTSLTAFTKCPTLTPDPYGEMQQGIGIYDNFAGGDVTSDGRYAEQRFTAPAGTRITAAEITRDIGNRSQFWHNYGRIDGVDQAPETCFAAAGEAFCRISGLKVFSGLTAQTLAYGARCDTPDPYCVNGSTLHRVWALVLSATVTLDDIEEPTVSTPATTGLADGAWHRGSGSITFTAEDNTGIRVRRLVDGPVTRATATAPAAGAGGCGTLNTGIAYSYTQPCAGSRGLNGSRAVTVGDVCTWGDGEHQIRAAAEDTGGATATSSGSVTVRVDCTAPAVTAGPGSDRTVPAGYGIEPQIAATDAHEVASTEAQYQIGSSGIWRTYTGPVAAEPGFSYRFRARATDSLGNTSAWSAASAWTHGGLLQTAITTARPSDETAIAQLLPTKQAPGETGPTLVAPPIATLRAPTARVTSARFVRRTRTLRVVGTATGAAEVALTIRTNAKKPLTRRARVRHGRFALTVRFSKRTRRARVVGIRVYPLR